MKNESKLARELAENSQKRDLRKKAKMPRFYLWLSAIVLILNAFVVLSSMMAVAEGGPPRIWTDKEDYYPEETVIISGENYTGNDPIEVKITRPDNEVEYSNTTADEFGSFTTYYDLDGVLGEYLVEATDDHGLYNYTTFTDGKPPSLFGWDWKFDDWTKSTLEGYGAGDWVWWHVKLYNEDPGTYKLVWNHDYYNKLISAYGFIEIKDVRLLYDDYPNENETGIEVTVEGPFYPEVSNTILIEFNATFTIETKGDYYLRWDARIDANETISWPGKALHTHFETWYYNGEEQTGGQQDVQVEQPLSPPLSKISGYKWYDMNGDGIWDEGEPGLENWTMHLTGEDIYGKNVSRYQITDENGYYQFAGLIKGNYTVCEYLKYGWTCTNRTGDPPCTDIIQITEDDTNLTHVDFGNRPLAPAIEVNKTSDMTEAHENDTVTYTVIVTNIGESTLYNVSVYDDVTDQYYYKVDYTGSDELAPDENWTLTYNYTIQPGDDDPLVNTATANGTDPFGIEVTDDDSWTIDILHPDIDVDKTGPAEAHVNDTITYTIVVTNTGDCPLYNVYVNDTQLGWSVGPMTLAVNESKTYYVNYTITGSEGDPFTNTANAEGTDNLGETVTDEDSHTVDILHPDIDVDKTGPAEAHVNDTITYTIVVKNTGDCPLYNVYVNDTQLGWSVGPMTLAVNESKTYYVNYTITGSEGDPFTNTAIAEGTDNLGETVTDEDSHTVDILHPDIDVDKTGPAEAHVNDTITYTIVVKNTGDCPLYNVYVNDTQLGWSVGPMTLAVNESKTYYVNYTITGSEGDPFTNTANAEGTDNLGETVTDSDSHTVDILHPDIDVDKTGPAEAHVNDTITYTIVVTNTGDCPLYNVYVNDTQLGWSVGPMTLAVNESKTYYVNYTITGSEGDPFTNTATTEGTDNLGETVTDEDSHTVDILHPDIDVDKTGPAEAHVNDTITYTIVVTNTGDCPLYNVYVNDTQLGWSVGPMTLAVNESKTYYVNYTITGSEGDPFTNTATTEGTDNLGETVTDDDSHTVDILHPDIDVDKTGPAEAHVNDTITYTIVVKNTGDCPLYNVYVNDTQLGWSVGPMTLAVNESKTYYVNYTITGSEGDPFTNTANAEGTDNLGETVTDSDSHTVDILHPDIDVDKTGPAEAHVNDTITYTIVVKNTGDCPLYNVYVNDTQLGWSVGPMTLAVNESKTYYVNYTITGSEGDPFTNTATTEGTDNLGETVTDEDSHTVDILHPDIDVDKTGPAEAHVNDTITYTIVVKNTGDCPLYNVYVNDTQLGWSVGPMTLAVNESKTYYVNYTITGSEGDPFTNTANAEGTDNLGETVTDSDSHTVDILHPDIDVDKTGPAEAHVNDTITYTIVVKNTGDCPLYNVYVNDTQLGWSVGPMTLAVNESKTYYVNYTITGSEGDPFTNTANAEGTDNLGETVTDSDSHTVDILHPDIDVDKTGPAEAHVNDTITYTIVVKNTGDCPLYNVYVNDTQLGWSVGPMTLAVNESKTYYVNYTITGSEGDPFTNTANAEGTDNLGETVTDSDSHTVDILHPDIDVDKTGPAEAHVNDTITYTIVVTNTGDCPLYNVYVNDTQLGWSVGPMTLAVNESKTYYVNYTITGSEGDPFTNTANAEGTDNLGETVTDSDSHTVDILHPDIDVDKTGPAEAHVNDTITYTIVVTNTGDCPLYNVYVNDTQLGWSVGPMTLAVNESKTYYVNYTITGSEGDPFTNTAIAEGTDNLGETVTDEDSHTVDILHPDIDVDKTGPSQAHVNDTITYTIVVTNTGDCPLYNVYVNDTQLGWSVGPMTLAVNESKTYYVNYTITGSEGDPFTNTANAEGTDNLGETVTDSDSHTVDILHPDIDVDKTGPAEAHVNDTITYTIVVKNTGDCPLYNVYVNDTQLGWSVGPMTLAVNESKTYYVNYTITGSEGDPFTNTAIAEGTDNLGETVTDEDSHTVDILHPDIDVDKTGPAEAHVNDTITYTIVVKNTGDCPLYNVYVNDTQLGWSVGPMTLAVNESKTYYVNYTITGSEGDPFTNTAIAEGTDNLGETVTDSDSHTVDILHPDIDVDKTGPAEAHVNDTIKYTIVVTNTGDCPLYNVYVNDTQLGWSVGPMTLAVNESKTYYVNYTITGSEGDPFTNTAIAEGTDNLGETVTDEDSHTVDILHPDIDVDKTGPAEAHVNDTITYTIVVTNTGDCPLYNVYVNDTQLGWSVGPMTLAVNESKTYYVNYTITGSEGDPFTNTAIAEGTDNLGETVTDEDSHTVDILHPDIDVDKTGPSQAHVNDTITYTIVVTNTGDCPLYNVYVNDTTLGWSVGHITLAVNESKTYYVNYTITGSEGDPFTNTATTEGTDNLGETVTDEDSHTVDILHPDIDVDKTGPSQAHVNDTITYTIVVTNTGDCTLYNVYVNDTQLGWSVGPMTLAVNESKTYYVNYTITGSEGDPFDNTAIAEGKDEIGGDAGTVTDDDDHTVDILHPAIDMTKTADKTYAYWEDTVTYTFTVHNIGDCTLYNVTVVDTIFGNLTGYLPDDTLDIGEINTFTFTYTIPKYSGDIVNVVTATGEDALHLEVSDSDGWTVVVTGLPPSMVTDTNYCYFDRDPQTPGQQFRLIFTQEMTNTFKLTASNPGQFYYNVFYVGAEGYEVTLNISIPYPFVTQGAVPIHVYGGVSYGPCDCFIPSDELSGFTITGTETQTPSGALGIVLSDYTNGFVTITVTGTVPSSGLVYVTVHLDFGLKGTGGYQKGHNDDAINILNPTLSVPNYSDFEFSVSGDMEDTQVVQNMNRFKRNPGFGGLVTDEFGNPVEGYIVRVFDSDGNLIGEAVTDEDGFWFIYYKHKGKREQFTVKLFDDVGNFVDEEVVELKANKFIEVNFVV